jgi:DNA-binding beta-propeller fold protein YncE
MQSISCYFLVFIMTSGCQPSGNQTGQISKKPAESLLRKDSLPAPQILRSYSDLDYSGRQVLTAAPGTKSVLFNSTGSRLYAMNLEGMSVYEFSQPTKKLLREFKFRPSAGMGWDYNKNRPIASFQEKPVEACFSHNDKILWVSLHNAGGIVPIWVDDYMTAYRDKVDSQKTKQITVIYPDQTKTDIFNAPLIATGKTPKVIAKTTDSRNLLVSNWHSRSVSILELNEKVYPFGKVVRTIPVTAIPRGIAVNDLKKRSYVAIMGGSSLAVVNHDTWQGDSVINVASNPRHVVMDTSGHLFLSYNSLAQIACLDEATGKTLFTASTHAQPRTIVLSKNKKFIFVTCYSGDMVDVYKINPDGFSRIASLPCGGHPVGVDVFEDNDTLEAWVCSYNSGTISVYSFKKK